MLLNSTSFIVNWTISDAHAVIWTNINTGVMDNITIPENTTSYTVTGLSVNNNYNVSVAIVDVCGMMTSDTITVNSKHICTHTYIILCNTVYSNYNAQHGHMINIRKGMVTNNYALPLNCIVIAESDVVIQNIICTKESSLINVLTL